MAKKKYKGKETCQKAFMMARDDGLYDREIAHNLNISESTFYQWVKDYPEFSEAIKKGRELSVDMVENALYKEALGYWTEETKTYVQENKNKEKITRMEKVKRFLRPSVTAQIFIVKNRRPMKWQDVEQIDLNTEQIIVVDVVE